MRFKIGAVKTGHHAKPGERAAANTYAGFWNDVVLAGINARFIPKNFRAVAFAVSQIGGGVETFAGLQNRDGKAAGGQVMGSERTTRPGTNDYGVNGLCHLRVRVRIAPAWTTIKNFTRGSQKRPLSRNGPRYEAVASLLTLAERSFFGVLQNVVSSESG